MAQEINKIQESPPLEIAKDIFQSLILEDRIQYTDRPNELMNLMSPAAALPQQVGIGTQNLDSMHSQDLYQSISSCRKCPISHKRKKVVSEKNFERKPYFILQEFPDNFDEDGDTVFSPQSKTSQLALKLVEKLNLREKSHLSFALKCNPTAGLPETSLHICAKENLLKELHAIKPTLVLSFGARSLFSLMQISQHSLQMETFQNFTENKNLGTFSVGAEPFTVLQLMDLRDLHEFPHWRSLVWDFLKSEIKAT